MPVINGIKFACAPCMRGHRSSKCTHADRVLVKVRKPGRPLSACPHNTGTDAFVHSSPGTIEKESANGTKQTGKCPTGECGCNSSVTSVAIPNVASCSCGAKKHHSPSESQSSEENGVENDVSKTNGHCEHSKASPPPSHTNKIFKRGSLGVKKNSCVFYGVKDDVAQKILEEAERQANSDAEKDVAMPLPNGEQGAHDGHEVNGNGTAYNSIDNTIINAVDTDRNTTNGNTVAQDLFPNVETQLEFGSNLDGSFCDPNHMPEVSRGSCCGGGSGSGGNSHSNGHGQSMSPPLPTPHVTHRNASSNNHIQSPLHSPFIDSLNPPFFPGNEQYRFSSPSIIPQTPNTISQPPSSIALPPNPMPQPANSWPYTPTPHAGSHTINATLTPEEWAWLTKLRATGFFQTPTAPPKPAPMPRPIRAPGSCVCGDLCSCIGCADHPYNPRMLGYVKELSQMTNQQSSTSQSQTNTPLATPTLEYTHQGRNVQQSGSCCGNGGGEPRYTPQTQTQNQSINMVDSDPASPEGPEVTMSPSDFMIVDYKLGSCSTMENGCMCGEGCTCLGCLTHGGHNGIESGF